MEKENNNSGQVLDLKMLRKLLSFVFPYKSKFWFLVLLTVSLAILAPAQPFLIQHIIDNEIIKGDYQGLFQMTALLIGLLFIQTIVQYLHTYLSGWLGQYIIHDLRVKLYRHLVKFRLKFFDNTPIGRLVTRTVSDIETLSDVFSQGIAAIIADFLQLVFILIIMFYTNWKLALISLSMLPLLILSTYAFKEKIKLAFNEVRTATSNLNTFVQERITGMSIVQIFGNEQRELEKFKAINGEHRHANLKTVKYYSIYFPVAEILSATGIGLLIWIGTKDVMHESQTGITLGILVAFIMYIQMFFRPIRMIADRFNTLQLGIVSTSRIVSLLDNEDHIVDNGNFKLGNIKGDVVFDKVWFAYNQDDYVLKNISFKASSGKTVAIVGATGAGKSSVINLLSRFYEVNKGSIKIDQHNINTVPLNNLRQNIGIVLQDVFLFSDTIRYNVTLGNSFIKEETIIHAAKLVGAWSFICELPGMLDYNVMERGATLSVGQRQLISFVRTMVYDPKILILDEATSSVDTETEEMVQQAISKMMSGRTAIIIAHRLSTIQKADKIIVLDKGEIKEEGSHDELIHKNGYYAELYRMQHKETV